MGDINLRELACLQSGGHDWLLNSTRCRRCRLSLWDEVERMTLSKLVAKDKDNARHGR